MNVAISMARKFATSNPEITSRVITSYLTSNNTSSGGKRKSKQLKKSKSKKVKKRKSKKVKKRKSKKII